MAYIKAISVLIFISASLFIFTGSYGQIPTPTKTGDKPKTQAATNPKPSATDQRGTEKEPLFIKGLVITKQTDEEATKAKQVQDEKSTNESGLTFFTGELAFFTKLLFVVAFAQAGLFFWQLTLMRRSLKPAEQSAQAALEMAKSMTLSERAYVKMSHCPPGLYRAPAPQSIYVVNIQGKNFGQTPATVTDVLLTKKVLQRNERLPTVPDYSVRAAGESPNIFLIQEDEFFTPYNFPISDDERSGIEDRTLFLYVYGYIDYIDWFGGRHRAGYARRFNGVFGGEGNLNFVIQEGYNYDRPRQQGEGNDWDEPSA